MKPGVKRDVKMLVLMAVVLSLFNLFSMQAVISDSREGSVRTEFGQALSSRGLQQGAIASNQKELSSPDSESDFGVFNYVNNKLKKYGYGPVDFSQQNGGSDTSVTISDDTGDGSGSQDLRGNDEGQANPSRDNDSVEGSEHEETSEVPPNEDGPPAESVDGKNLNFDIDFGFG